MTPAYWNSVRRGYEAELPHILKASACSPPRRVDPYFVDWVHFFTPIEMAAWLSIRAIGVPLYPQFPALDYFIDFANPHFKIGLELDGKDFHDKERDRVFEISGCGMRKVGEYSELPGVKLRSSSRCLKSLSHGRKAPKNTRSLSRIGLRKLRTV